MDALFPGSTTREVATAAGRIFVRVMGSGPPLLLVHGFPQTHAMWHRLAPVLAGRFTLVMPDLRGYGRSSAPEGDAAHAFYSKRAMAEDMIAVMDALGHDRFRVVGHDRGARVSYRLALDHPARVERLALLDIAPTVVMWDTMDAARALKVYHWAFLAQPKPMPERLLEGAPTMWIDHTIASWTRDRNLEAFDPRALDDYRAFFSEPARIHACCEDYRAGATVDVEHDRADLAMGKRIFCPVSIIWGSAGIPAAGGPLNQWIASFAPQAEGRAVDAGHFVAEENPAATLETLLPFLAA